MFKNILMPTDGSEHSERAIERGIELAKLCRAKVTGIHVVPEYRLMMAFAEGVYPDSVAQEKVEEDAVRLYAQGWSTRQVAERFECSYGVMRTILLKRTTLRGRGGSTR